jgi:hypothetical protein
MLLFSTWSTPTTSRLSFSFAAGISRYKFI